ncbi:MAG: DNA alkylation repair protein [Ignavibacteria bacterium]
MGRFGINTEKAYGISMPNIRKVARKYRHNHELALSLWETGIHEARIAAALMDDPKKVTQTQMEKWVKDFNSWDLCDQCCGNLFDRTPYAHKKAVEWCKKEKEFVKRAGFALMAWLAVHDKKADNKKLSSFFPLIEKGSDDDRNFVKKAVNWALRQIGKRNSVLNSPRHSNCRENQGTKYPSRPLDCLRCT